MAVKINLFKTEAAKLLAVIGVVCLFSLLMLINVANVNAASSPEGPDSVSVIANETKTNVTAYTINISGGKISTINMSATVQNPRWKAFVGWVSGMFTLDDSTGATVYDWNIATVNGRVFATRNSSFVNWWIINCSNKSLLELENVALSHSNVNDNLTATFTVTGGTHDAFTVATRSISSNWCPTLNTYVNNSTQDGLFEEVAMYDNYSTVYAALLEPNKAGFDGVEYDFQMIVPDNGLSTWTSSIAYYLYIELD
jgi:hypothetical protein